MKLQTILRSLISISAAMLGGVLSAASLLPDPFDQVNVHTWVSASVPEFFPERDDTRVSVHWLKERPSFGIAFSGGGTRSATATLGELRALKALGWIDRAQYISANSGGSWTVVPFIYLPKQFDENRFLGAYIPPGKITDAVLEPDSTADEESMSAAIYRAKIGTKIASLRRGDEAYADVVGKIFLEPFKLHDREKVFTFHEAALKAVLRDNKDLKAADFYTVRDGRPYLIAVGSLRVPLKGPDASELFLVEATPLYTGVRNEFKVPFGKNGKEILIGGGYVESFGYDSHAPKSDKPSGAGLWEVELEGGLLQRNKRYRFTLSDVIGMSGAAPAITIADKHVHAEVFPEFRHWAVDRKKGSGDSNLRKKAKEFKHGDGGDIDNLAFLPLLARRVENILVFVNTRTKLRKNADCGNITTKVLVDDVISLFRPIGKLTHNVVIDDQDGKRLEGLCQAFVDRKKSREPLVHCDRYTIRDNARQAVRGAGYQPSICWVYLDRTRNWIDKIDAGGGRKTRDLKAGTGDFDNFPHYRTFSEKTGLLIDLDRERVHALSNLTAWTVLTSKDYIAQQLAGAFLPTNTAVAAR